MLGIVNTARGGVGLQDDHGTFGMRPRARCIRLYHIAYYCLQVGGHGGDQKTILELTIVF